MPSSATPLQARGRLAALLSLTLCSIGLAQTTTAPVLPPPLPPIAAPLTNLIDLPAEPQEVIGVAADALPGREGDPITGILAVRAVGGTVVRLFDAGTGKLRREVRLPPEVIASVTPAISPDGKWLAVALETERSSHDGMIGLFSTFPTPQYRGFMRTPGLRGTIGFAFSPDGKRLAVANQYSYIQLWNTETKERLTTLKGNFPPEAMTFSPDNKLLMPRFKGQKDTFVLSAADGKPVATLPVASGELLPGGIFVAPEGRALLLEGSTPLPLPLPAYLAGGASPAGFDCTGKRVLVTLPPLPSQPNATTVELREVMTGTVLARQVLLDVKGVRLMPSGEQILLEGTAGLRLLSLR